MGIWERPPAHFLDQLQAEFGFNPPRENGYDTVDAIRALRDGTGQDLHRARWQLRAGCARYRGDLGGVTRGTADGADFNQDQQITPDMWCDGVDLADPGSYRGRRTGKRSAVRLRGGLDLLRCMLPEDR